MVSYALSYELLYIEAFKVWREEIIAYECASHSSNVKALKYMQHGGLLFVLDLSLELALKTLNLCI